MNKKFTIWGVIGVILVIILIYGITSYNSLVSLKEDVDAKVSEIDVQLERRADLIPNLINTVKGYVAHEDEVIEAITKARENLMSAKSIEDKANANEELSNSLDALFVIVENYPDLKSSENFINLQDELAGTENRIAVARNNYNEVVQNYNKSIKKFPKNIIAGMFNYEEADYFKADDSKKEAPDVDFS